MAIRAELDEVIQHYKEEEGKRIEKEMLDEIRSQNAMSRGGDTNDTKSRSQNRSWKKKLIGEVDSFDQGEAKWLWNDNLT